MVKGRNSWILKPIIQGILKEQMGEYCPIYISDIRVQLANSWKLDNVKANTDNNCCCVCVSENTTS